MLSLYPTADHVLVEREQAQGVTKGGIILPDAAKTSTNRGVVKAVGDGKWQDGKFVETRVKPEQTVIFGAYAGSEVEIEGKKYLLMSEKDILAVIK